MNNSSITVSFGRMNPPTIGHKVLIDTVKRLSPNSHIIFVSSTSDNNKNPIPIKKKLEYLKSLFPDTNFESNPLANNPISIMKFLNGKYDDIVFVCGLDRRDEYNGLLNKYNGKEYNFNSITIIEAGDRNSDKTSATQAREYVQHGSYSEFCNMIPGDDLGLKYSMFTDINEAFDNHGRKPKGK